MKARLIGDDNRCTDDGVSMKFTVIDNRNGKQRRYWKAGAIVDHPKAYRLVQMGVAEPVDEECIRAAGMTDEQMQLAQVHQEAVKRGITYEDLPRFFAGEMAGYNYDGSEIPGPNAHNYESGTTSPGGIYIP